MDLPLFNYKRRSLPVEDDSSSDDDGGLWLDNYDMVKRALQHDNKDDFVKVFNSYTVKELDRYLFSCLQFFMLTEDAVECVAAVLDGETGICDITHFMPCDPLHRSASDRAVRITALLLERGFSADVRYDCDWADLHHVLPLGVALYEARGRHLRGFLVFDNEKISAVKFTIELLRHFTLQTLETVRLLAMKTRDIKQEFFNYLKEGKMVEVGALLLVARSRILSSSTPAGEGEFSSILEMHDFLSEEMTSYTNSKTLLSDGDDEFIEMEQTLLLLQIFDTIGDKLEALLLNNKIPREPKFVLAAFFLEEAGFDVNADDYPDADDYRNRFNTL